MVQASIAVLFCISKKANNVLVNVGKIGEKYLLSMNLCRFGISIRFFGVQPPHSYFSVLALDTLFANAKAYVMNCKVPKQKPFNCCYKLFFTQ